MATALEHLSHGVGTTTQEYPLSPMQDGMLFHHLAGSNQGVDVEQILCQLPEKLDEEALVAAFNSVIQAHPALRTYFAWRERSHPVQRVADTATQPVEYVDLTPLGEHQQALRLSSLLQTDRLRTFDLATAPLSRLTLLRLGAERSGFLWTFHHILLDGRSFPLVLTDVFAAYGALRNNQALNVQSRPSILNIDPHFTAALARPEDLEFFRALLEGYDSPLPLDVGFCARTKRQTLKRSTSRTLSAEQTQALRDRATALNVAPSTLFQTAWALLLSHYGGRKDVVFGATRSCRNPEIPGIKDAVGLLVNTIPMRVKYSPKSTIAELLQSVREQQNAQREHEVTPLSQIQMVSDLPVGTPLFESITMLDHHSLQGHMEQQSPGFASMSFEHFGRTNFPLCLLGYLDSAMTLRLEFDPHRYDLKTAERMLKHLEYALLSLVTLPPDTTLRNVAVLSPNERTEILQSWNQTAGPFPTELRLHNGFELQAQTAPDAPAVLWARGQLTYGELDAQANRFANLLRSRGVSRGDLVAVRLPRSPRLIPALLGVLKAGAAYVPVDADHPQERQAFMIEDSGAKLLLTDQTGREQFGTLCDVLCVSQDAEAIAAASSLPPHCPSAPTDLAYVIYTSGSTGKPKGVAVQHQAAVNLIDWVNETFNLEPTDRLLFVTSVCFDLSVYDIFGILSAGASLRIATTEELKDPRTLASLLMHGGISFWDSAPAALNQLVPFLEPSCLESNLRLVFMSGDWIPVTLPNRLRTSFPNAEVVSLGGATEAAIWSNFYRIGHVDPHWPSIPYGHPIRNARYYILSDELEPVPVGVPGHLHIGGLCLAYGYHHRPSLTAERFIVDPFSPVPGGRMYRTGDLARFMPDGTMEFLGRMDHQVKVRGYRVELGEIEAAIQQRPEVATCVVDAPKDASEERTLVAYVVAQKNGTTPNPVILREHCQELLPEYMVPAHFVFLDQLPTTANGKLDRKALPAPKTEASADFVAPQTPQEEAVASIFRRHLGVERVGRDDDLFELGGHSLLAVRILGAIQSELGAELQLRQILKAPTVAAICEAIAALPAKPNASTPKPPYSSTAEATTTKLLSFAQQRMAFIQQMTPKSPTYNIPFLYAIQGHIAAEPLNQALRWVMGRHDSLRTCFPMERTGPSAQVLQTTDIAPPIQFHDVSNLPTAVRTKHCSKLIYDQTETPFDLAEGPLLRGLLLKHGDAEYQLLLVVHHIIFDGESTAIVQQELLHAYDHLVNGDPVPDLPTPPPFQYFAAAQYGRAGTGGFRRELDYFSQQLQGTLPLLQLPHDRTRPPVQSYAGASYHLVIPRGLSQALSRLARQQDATMFMVLLAAYAGMLHRFTGQDDLIVGLPVSSRITPELQALVGLCINTVPVRLDTSPELGFDTLLTQTKQRTLDAIEHGDLPFERLVEVVAPPRDQGLTPIFQCLFSFQEVTGRAIKGDHFQLTPRPVPLYHSRTDLSLFLEHNADVGVYGYFEYSTDLFDEATITRLVHGLLALLEHIVQEPEAQLQRLRVMDASARAAQLSRLSGPLAPFKLERTTVHMFAATAQQHPERLALQFENQSRTYGQLLSDTRQLTSRLVAAGAGPGRGVALFVERGLNMVTAMLATLHAGAHYIPLDPSHPAERNRLILEAAAPSLIVTDQSCQALLPQDLDTPLLDLDQPQPIGTLDGNEQDIRAHADNLAYIIFTSGSTGRPKGVEVGHRALANFLNAMAIRPGLTPDDHLLATTTLSFDIAVLELLLPLTVGASVRIVSRADARNPRALAAHIKAEPATLFQATPATYRMLLDDGWSGQKGLVALCGGEALPRALAEQLSTKVATLWNMYGPTEATVWASVEAVDLNADRITIGRPIHNTHFYVLNGAQEPVPPGVPGDLYIGGVCLAQGYHRNSKLTNGVFVQDPYSETPGARMYRTGDLARCLPDGRLECLGRTDFQVKLRGFRLELGEVEHALCTHPNVIQAVAHLQQAEDAPLLVGYIVCDPPSDLIPQDLMGQLQQQLPSYMIPSLIVALREFPLTPNGKVDRKALPVPDRRMLPTATAEVVQPRNPREQRIAQIFASTLGLADRIDVHCSFFDMGGHSLLATRVVREISEAFKVDISLGALFANPTVARLAELVCEGGAEADTAVVPLQHGGHLPPMYFICGIHLYQDLARRLDENQPSYGIFLPVEEHILSGQLKGEASVESLARLYADVITRHCPTGPFSLCGISFGAVLAYEMARQLSALGRDVLLLTMIAPVMPSSLSRNHVGWLKERVGNLLTTPPDRARVKHKLQKLGPQHQSRRLRPYAERVMSRLGLEPAWMPPIPQLDPASTTAAQLRAGFYRQAGSAYDRQIHSYSGEAIVIRAAGERFEHFEVAPDLGWGRRIPALRAFQAPGEHLTVLDDAATAAILRHELATVYAEHHIDMSMSKHQRPITVRPFIGQRPSSIAPAPYWKRTAG